jgi:hypothetical protein
MAPSSCRGGIGNSAFPYIYMSTMANASREHRICRYRETVMHVVRRASLASAREGWMKALASGFAQAVPQPLERARRPRHIVRHG